MRNGSLEYGNLYKILLGCFYTLGDSCGNFTSFAKTPTNDTVAVTDNNNGCESKGATSLSYFGNTVDGNQSVFQLNVTIYFNFIYCHNRLEIKSTFTSCISQRLYSAMIEITVTVKDYAFNASLLGLLGYQFANLLSLFDLRHSLKTERRCRCKSFTFQIIYHLSINLLVTTENAQAGTLGCAENVLTNSVFDLNSSFYFLCCHNLQFI